LANKEPMKTTPDRVHIFEYNNYREYLADYFSKKKATMPTYSHRVFARQAGLSSPSHLLMIITGKRNLSLKTIQKFSEGLRLTQKEKRYFELMVQYEQTEDLHRKSSYFSEIMSLKASTKKLHRLEKERFDFLSKWYVVAVYVLIDLKNFCSDPDWIAKRLNNKLSPAQAKEALETLLRLGMIEVDKNRGYRQVANAVTIADDTKSLAVYNYHESMIRLASEALRSSAQNMREMNGATIHIPISKMPELKEKIRAFRKEINQMASSYENPDEVFQLNIQLFPLSSVEEK
jgi:uncharacterized protein (TIGR02147 family)